MLSINVKVCDMASKSKVTVRQAAAMAPAVKLARLRRRPPASPFPKGNEWGFKKGQSGNPGGKPKVLQRFSARVAEELMKDCPAPLRATLGLRKGATVFDAMVTAATLEAARGDMAAFVTLRETVEGKLPMTTKNLNVSVSMQRFLEDPAFRDFLDKQHAEFLKLSGEDFTDGYPRNAIATDVQSLSAGNDATGVQKD